MSQLALRPRRLGSSGGSFTEPTAPLAVADKPALAALGPGDRANGLQVWVSSEGDQFVFSDSSTAAEDANTVRPGDVDAGLPGRWVREIEKGAVSGVATLDAFAALVQAAKLLKEGGGTILPIGAVADGHLLRRVGGNVVGIDLSAGGALTPHDQVFTGDGATTTFTLEAAVPAGLLAASWATRNGNEIFRVTAASATIDEFRISGDQLTLGGVMATGEKLKVHFWT